MSLPASSQFLSIYDSLPHDEQRTLVAKFLAPLLDSTAEGSSTNALSAAAAIKKRHAGMPDLDLRGKKAELNAMLEELNKDIKRSFVTEGSSRVELLNESVSSLADWLNDIWRVVFEHRVDYELAHECLLFVIETLDQIAAIRTGCKCALTNMYIPVTLRTKSGRKVKTFHIVGAQSLEEVLEFIWRDMFLSMLAHEQPRTRPVIRQMLEDIEQLLDWRSVFKIFYGGKNCAHEYDVDEESDEEEESEEDEVDDDEGEGALDEDSLPVVDDDDDDEFVDEDDEDDEEMPQRCDHWSTRMNYQVKELRRLIQEALLDVFKQRPSLELFFCLSTLSDSPEGVEFVLLKTLEGIATASSDTFVTALEIYATKHKPLEILKLLDSSSHLLRPRDFDSLKSAARVLATEGHVQRALQMLEKELLETARCIRQALLLSYSQLDTADNKEEIISITKSRSGTVGRRERVEAWVDSITTPGAEQPNPFMFAAMMMGMPAMPGMSQDDDQYTYLDIDPGDPDLADLRGEYRPALKKRFEGWADLGHTIKGGAPVLLKVYKDLIDMMPFLRATDATEEMIARLQDRTSKKYVCEGLDALLAFVKVQRRKWNVVRNEMRKKKEGEAVASGNTATAPTPSGSSPRAARNPAPPTTTARTAPVPFTVPIVIPASSLNPPPLEPLPSAASASSSGTTGAGPSTSNHAPPPISSAPSFSSFSWQYLDSDEPPPLIPASAVAPPYPTPPAPAPAPPPPATAATVFGPMPAGVTSAQIFTPFGFFFPSTANNPVAGPAPPPAGPTQYNGSSVDDVD